MPRLAGSTARPSSCAHRDPACSVLIVLRIVSRRMQVGYRERSTLGSLSSILAARGETRRRTEPERESRQQGARRRQLCGLPTTSDGRPAFAAGESSGVSPRAAAKRQASRVSRAPERERLVGFRSRLPSIVKPRARSRRAGSGVESHFDQARAARPRRGGEPDSTRPRSTASSRSSGRRAVAQRKP